MKRCSTGGGGGRLTIHMDQGAQAGATQWYRTMQACLDYGMLQRRIKAQPGTWLVTGLAKRDF